MPIIPPNSPAVQPPSMLDLITNALIEIGAYSMGEPVDASEATFCMSKFNRMLDSWNTQKLYAYNRMFASIPLIPNHQPHTIGPGANFDTPQRPVTIENANIVLNTVNPPVRSSLNIRDDDWWANQRVQGIATTLPTDLYYSPEFPIGNMYLWPIPTLNYLLEIWSRVVLSQVGALNVILSLPPGYEDALTLSLAEILISPFQAQLNPVLIKNAQMARSAIQRTNSKAPTISTMDSGMPSNAGRNITSFNYRTGVR
jgi:hypothetical protein